MKQFANIASVLVLSGAACFAAMGCAVASGDGSVDDEGVSAVPSERQEGAAKGIEGSLAPGKELPGKELSKPMPSTEQLAPEKAPLPSEKAPLPSKSPSELSKKAPATELPSVKAPPFESKVPSASEFGKKAPSGGKFESGQITPPEITQPFIQPE
jgi:hypothetical protein